MFLHGDFSHGSSLHCSGGQPGDDPALESQHQDDDGDRDDDRRGHDVGHRGLEIDAPWKKASAAGTVRALSVDVSEMANRKSFQQKKNVRIAVVNTPGAASGTITLRNACHEVAPSTCAACSISHGICRKNADMVQIDSGSAKVRYGMIRPIQVS